MPVTAESLGITRLSVVERLALIEEIWDSLPEQVEAEELAPWQRAEIARRRADAEARPGVGRPWRDVLGELEGRS
ncbi:MAG: addiction module protein [Gemmataceae bacterium]